MSFIGVESIMYVPPFMLSMILLLIASISSLLSQYDNVCLDGSSPITFNSLFFPSIILYISTIELQRKSVKSTYNNTIVLSEYSLCLPFTCLCAGIISLTASFTFLMSFGCYHFFGTLSFVLFFSYKKHSIWS